MFIYRRANGDAISLSSQATPSKKSGGPEVEVFPASQFYVEIS